MKDPVIAKRIGKAVELSAKILDESSPGLAKPPDRKFLMDVIGTKQHLDAEGIGDLEFYFDKNGIVNYADYDGLPMATPKTRLEVIMLVWCLWYGLK